MFLVGPYGPLTAVLIIKLTYMNTDTDATARPKRIRRLRRTLSRSEGCLLSLDGTVHLSFKPARNVKTDGDWLSTTLYLAEGEPTENPLQSNTYSCVLTLRADGLRLLLLRGTRGWPSAGDKVRGLRLKKLINLVIIG